MNLYELQIESWNYIVKVQILHKYNIAFGKKNKKITEGDKRKEIVI